MTSPLAVTLINQSTGAVTVVSNPPTALTMTMAQRGPAGAPGLLAGTTLWVGAGRFDSDGAEFLMEPRYA